MLVSLLFVALLAWLGPTAHAGQNWVGADSFFLYALSPADRIRHLTAMHDAHVRVLRIFVSAIGQGSKGTSARTLNDVEPKELGVWDDRVLEAIDQLMLEVAWFGIKLDISMHDRYSLGCWAKDAYYYTYSFPDGTGPSGCNAQKNDAHQFYHNSTIEAVFDNRLIHMLQHQNPYFNNRTWGSLNEAVFTFAAENEHQGYIPTKDWMWACRRAATMRKYISNGVLISVNGATVDDSLQQELLQCDGIDLIGVHNYANGGSTSFAANYSSVAVALAKAHNKRAYVEEFGATGPDAAKSTGLAAQMAGILSEHLPAMPWEILDCQPVTLENEFFNGTGTALTWQSFSLYAQRATEDREGAFDWPEVLSPPPHGFSIFNSPCSEHQQCATRCCSNSKCALPSAQCTASKTSSSDLLSS